MISESKIGLVDIPTLLTQLGLTTFSNAINANGFSLLSTLQSRGPWTVFAPSNNAFSHIEGNTLTNLLHSPQLLTQLVLNHVVHGFYPSSALTNGTCIIYFYLLWTFFYLLLFLHYIFLRIFDFYFYLFLFISNLLFLSGLFVFIYLFIVFIYIKI